MKKLETIAAILKDQDSTTTAVHDASQELLLQFKLVQGDYFEALWKAGHKETLQNDAWFLFETFEDLNYDYEQFIKSSNN